MHPNAALLQRLFAALDRRDHTAIIPCYHPQATFHDIAFDLPKMQSIACMWHMICKRSDIRVTVEAIEANDVDGYAKIIDVYTYKKKHTDPTGRPVRNVIESRFKFRDGLIIEHRDECNECVWAAMALGCGMKGFLAAQFGWARRSGAKDKLNSFLEDHPEYKRT